MPVWSRLRFFLSALRAGRPVREDIARDGEPARACEALPVCERAVKEDAPVPRDPARAVEAPLRVVEPAVFVPRAGVAFPFAPAPRPIPAFDAPAPRPFPVFTSGRVARVGEALREDGPAVREAVDSVRALPGLPTGEDEPVVLRTAVVAPRTIPREVDAEPVGVRAAVVAPRRIPRPPEDEVGRAMPEAPPRAIPREADDEGAGVRAAVVAPRRIEPDEDGVVRSAAPERSAPVREPGASAARAARAAW